MTQVENTIITVIAAIATGFLVSGREASSSITKTYEDSALITKTAGQTTVDTGASGKSK